MSAPGIRTRLARADWDKILTDGAIYALALGGFYVAFKTLYALALAVGATADEAVVLSSLADIAILAYSRKAVREVKAGRSAWGIRLIVAGFSLATVALQLRSAWPHPVAVGFHALPPLVWITGHEMMLRGELRDAKKQLREREIEAGLRPAPLPRLRRTWWILDPYHTFIVWRLTKLWEKPADYVIRTEATKRQNDGKDIPRAWQSALHEPEPESEGEGEDQPGSEGLRLRTLNGEYAAPDACASFLQALQPVPEKDAHNRRSNDVTDAFVHQAQTLGHRFGLDITGVALAKILDVDPATISRSQARIRAAASKTLTSTP
ncbi:DUF2637 domain-containing protein [Streptomyces sp. cg35]|uniref:DUF2637 domain-containing protein n=1 Tax=Streptomyces sp. cg35 TaxID=3421650 RepID=UPI003D18207B